MKYYFSILLFLFNQVSLSQSIQGNFSQLANQEIRLEGFNGLKTYIIGSAKIDAQGNFNLVYQKSDYGVGFLVSGKEKPFLVLLSGEAIQLKGSSLSQIEGIKIIEGSENIAFDQYAKEHPRREQALSAWAYLEKMYQNDTMFSKLKAPAASIRTEKERIKKEDDLFIASLPSASYVRWFLPIRQLVSGVPIIAQYRPEEIPATIKTFRSLDYTDARLYKSGLFREAIENHFWLLENSGKPLDSVFVEMKLSIDAMLNQLVKDEKKLNEVTDHLFDLLERHSLFQASEYLAVKVLNQGSCTLDNNLANQLETYRAMKKGNIAPDLQWFGDSYGAQSGNFPKTLSGMKSKYTLVVYGASWCPKCKEEVPAITPFYERWKAQGVEVVFVSLDEDKTAFADFVKPFPFASFCDYKKWESPMVKSFYVSGTPSMFLLDANREIILRPNSVKQMDAWVDWFLEKGNKK